MTEEFAPVNCTECGKELPADEENWWGPWVYCDEHHEELCKGYDEYCINETRNNLIDRIRTGTNHANESN